MKYLRYWNVLENCSHIPDCAVSCFTYYLVKKKKIVRVREDYPGRLSVLRFNLLSGAVAAHCILYSLEEQYSCQGWEFALSLIDHLLIAPLLIRSDHSNQMSDCKRFAQIAQDK